MSRVLLRCGRLFDGYGGAPRSDAGVLLDGELIVKVAPWQDFGAGAAEVVDLRGSTVTPGFIDAHVHLLYNGDHDHESTRTAAETATPAQHALRAASSATQCLLGGVTTVRDCGDLGFVTLDLRDAIDAGLVPGPRVLAAGPPLTTTNGHLHWCGNTADSADELRAATDALCSRGVDLVKVMASGGNMTRESNKLLPQFSTEEIAVVVERAHRRGRRVAAHALNTEAIRRAVDGGVDTVEHCVWVDRDGNPDLDASVVERMAARPTWATVTMAGIARALLPWFGELPDVERAAAAAMSRTGDLYTDHDWARAMRAAGVHLVLASDAGVRFTPFNQFTQTIECGIRALGVGAGDAISMATMHAARALGIGDLVGTVEPGKIADLTVLDAVVEDSAARLGPVLQVWRNGRRVVDGQRVVDGHSLVSLAGSHGTGNHGGTA
jgi:imidazolonepropionase-like amidohydrolase